MGFRVLKNLVKVQLIDNLKYNDEAEVQTDCDVFGLTIGQIELVIGMLKDAKGLTVDRLARKTAVVVDKNLVPQADVKLAGVCCVLYHFGDKNQGSTELYESFSTEMYVNADGALYIKHNPLMSMVGVV